MLSLIVVRILFSLVTVTLVLGHDLLGPCRKLVVSGVATIDIKDSIISLRWEGKLNYRPDASGQMNPGQNSLIGFVNFPDDRTYQYNFYPEEDTIYWDGDKGTTTNIWHNVRCVAACKIVVPGVATIDIKDSTISLRWEGKWNYRPDASGQMNPGQHSLIGFVNFPDDRTYKFNYYPEEEIMYWDGDKGSTSNMWMNAKQQCEL